MDKKKYKSFYRRHLPHIHPSQAHYFITFRLANSLPKSVIEGLQSEYSQYLESLKGKESDSVDSSAKRWEIYFQKFDQLLDISSHGALWLKISEVAKITAEAIRYHDGKSYKLICFTILPNHVHLLIDHSIEKS